MASKSKQHQLTFGLELEGLGSTSLCEAIIRDNGFGHRRDRSILDSQGRETGLGREVITPIHTINFQSGEDVTFEHSDPSIDRVISALSQSVVAVNSSCGYHIHIGQPNGERSDWNPNRNYGVDGGPASEWKPQQIRTALLVGQILEEHIYSLVPESRKSCGYCQRIGEVYDHSSLVHFYPVGKVHPRKFNNKKRYCWMNLIETSRKADPEETRIGFARSKPYGTVEIRLLGETKDPEYLRLWSMYWLRIMALISVNPPELAISRILHSKALADISAKLRGAKNHHEATVAPNVKSPQRKPNIEHGDE
jgi:hypothetical protein